MKVLYLDCYSGISGDMFLGALIDAGCDMDALRSELSKLKLEGYRLKEEKSDRAGIGSTKFDVIVDEDALNRERTLEDILNIIEESALDKDIKEKASGIFRSLAEAEGRAHRKDLEDLHFHEVGDIDSIIDIVGALTALKIMNIDKVYASRINIGTDSTVQTRSGRLPVPGPAALNLLKGMPIVHSGIEAELVTPTGAALLTGLVDRFVDFPDMVLEDVGYGAGARDFKEQPNCLRVMIGESKEAYERDSVLVIEANIDDMNPVDYEHLTGRLFEEGALDVYLIPVQMKKTRPGVLLSVLAKAEDLERLSGVIFQESTSIGIRYYKAQRKKLKRTLLNVNTKYGNVRVKVSSGPDGVKRVVPEYEDYKKIADSKKIPLSQIRKEIEKAL